MEDMTQEHEEWYLLSKQAATVEDRNFCRAQAQNVLHTMMIVEALEKIQEKLDEQSPNRTS